MKKNSILYLLLITFISISCSVEENNSNVMPKNEQEIIFKYANHIRIFKNDKGFRVVIIGEKQILQEFLLSRDSSETHALKIPFSRVVATSTTHLGYLEMLDSRDVLVAFPTTKYISDKSLHKRALSGDLVELGTAESMNLEKLFELKPDIIFDFPDKKAKGKAEKLNKLGLKSIIITEFFEEDVLGKVEWIKFFGILLGKEELANKEFENIEKRYFNLVEEVKQKQGDSKPSVFSGVMFGDTWYAPGGDSFTSQLYALAGADYVWKSDSLSGSYSFSFEKVFKDAVNADYWVGVGGKKTLEALSNSNPNYSLFKAFKNKDVYSVYGGVTPWGANTYFERGVLQPDIILQDMIIIFDKNADKSKLIYHKRLD